MKLITFCTILLLFSSSSFAKGGASDGAGGGDLEIISNGIYNPRYWSSIGVNTHSEEVIFKQIVDTAKETSKFLNFLKRNHQEDYEYLMELIPEAKRSNQFAETQLSQLQNLESFELVDSLPYSSDAFFDRPKKSLYFLKDALGYLIQNQHLLRFLVFHETLGLMGIQKEDALVRDNPELSVNYPVTRAFRGLYYKHWLKFDPLSKEYPEVLKNFLSLLPSFTEVKREKPKFRPPDISPELLKESREIVEKSSDRFMRMLDLIFIDLNSSYVQEVKSQLEMDFIILDEVL